MMLNNQHHRAINIHYHQSTLLCINNQHRSVVRLSRLGGGGSSPHSFMFHNKSFSNNDFLSFVVSVNTVYLHIYINKLPASRSWNNGKEVPRWGVAEIQKMSPSTTGRCSRQTADQWERGTATRQPITQICSPGVVKLVYLQSRLGRTCEI